MKGARKDEEENICRRENIPGERTIKAIGGRMETTREGMGVQNYAQ